VEQCGTTYSEIVTDCSLNRIMQNYTIDQVCEERNAAITALIKLHSYSVTDEEGLTVYGFLNRSRLETIGMQTQDPFGS